MLQSETGCQQGDPLGPAIFSLAIHPVITALNSKFNIWYLDDGTIGDDATSVLNDLKSIKEQFKQLGLQLNFSKCELFLSDSIPTVGKEDIVLKFKDLAPDIKILNKQSLRLLGAPIHEDYPCLCKRANI